MTTQTEPHLPRIADRCPCGSARARTIARAAEYCTYGQHMEPYDYTLVRCRDCRLVRTAPAPADHEHAPFRDDAFIATYLERLELFTTLLRPTVEDIAALSPPPGHLVDVGANIGVIVEMARDLGYTATGIELNEAAVEHGVGRGLDLRACDLHDAGFAPGSLDVICLSATAEHIPDLDETFALCRDLLRDDGLLYVSNSPNLRSLGWWTERQRWYGLQPTGHVWQFTPQTLRTVFERTGFQVVAERTYNLHRDFGRNRKQRLKRLALALAERVGLGDALSMAGVKR